MAGGSSRWKENQPDPGTIYQLPPPPPPNPPPEDPPPEEPLLDGLLTIFLETPDMVLENVFEKCRMLS